MQLQYIVRVFPGKVPLYNSNQANFHHTEYTEAFWKGFLSGMINNCLGV